MVMLDRIDRAVLYALERDARLSYADLSERVGISKSPCWKRVQALESTGVIRAYRAIIDPAKIGLAIRAFVRIVVDFDKHAAFESEILRHPAVVACHTTAGEADYLIELLARDMMGLDSLLRQELCRLPGVQRFATTITMQTIKSEAAITMNIS